MDRSGTSTDGSSKHRRFGEPFKFIPVVFVACTIITLYVIYTFYHCVPMLQLGVLPGFVNRERRVRAIYQLVSFHIFTIMLLICYVQSVVKSPGEVPDNDPRWEYQSVGGNPSDHAPLSIQETKKSGDRRHCKWCGKYKPDRCHHCRVCRTCVLKMDHHCPWIYNCVGYKNYKFFFLVLFYALLDCHQIVWTMSESVLRTIYEPHAFLAMFALFFGETLAFFLGSLVTTFFCFHIYLMLKAMSTIEFCEKSLPKKEKDPEKSGNAKSYDCSAYDLGPCGNIRAVLGDNPLLWLFPCHQPAGDGLNFVSDETRLKVDVESTHGMRVKTHQKTQRAGQRRMRGLMRDDSDVYGASEVGYATTNGYGGSSTPNSLA